MRNNVVDLVTVRAARDVVEYSLVKKRGSRMSLEERAKLTYDLLHCPLDSHMMEALEALSDRTLEEFFLTRALIREHYEKPKPTAPVDR